mmetsp:Transcript_63643/g.183075  ORF Transcript_63643/g.183075 Transcript_63643/m.183075 type:complete len:221 (+) Transcript_63643:113-775(+)
MPGIDAAMSKQLATEMTEKYPVMVYCMAKQVGEIPAGSKISSCKVLSVSNTECEISYVTCRGDACAMPKKAIFKFNKPLGDKIYMKRLQSDICAPKFSWLFTKPLALLILVTCAFLSICAMGLGVSGMTEQLDRMPRTEKAIAMIFGSAHNFAVTVLMSWCVAVFFHFIEATVAYKWCERIPFSNQHSSSWALLVFLVGWPIFTEIKELFEVKAAHAKNK